MSAAVESSAKNADEEDGQLSEDDSSSSSGSAMDESVDSPQPMSVEHAESDKAPSIPDLPEETGGLEPVEPETDAQGGPHALPQRPPTPHENETLHEVDQEKAASNLDGAQTTREPSVMSDDVYEPPEPEPNPESANTVYTPPFSPPPPGPVEPEGTTAVPSPSSQLKVGKELTEEVQKPIRSDESHIEVLQVKLTHSDRPASNCYADNGTRVDMDPRNWSTTLCHIPVL